MAGVTAHQQYSRKTSLTGPTYACNAAWRPPAQLLGSAALLGAAEDGQGHRSAPALAYTGDGSHNTAFTRVSVRRAASGTGGPTCEAVPHQCHPCRACSCSGYDIVDFRAGPSTGAGSSRACSFQTVLCLTQPAAVPRTGGQHGGSSHARRGGDATAGAADAGGAAAALCHALWLLGTHVRYDIVAKLTKHATVHALCAMPN